jgi:hypothetical protein
MMTKGWDVQRWDTPVSDVQSLAMVSLVDRGQLSIVLEDVRSPKRRRFRFIFSKYPAYRNILEEYRLKLWKQLDEKTAKKLGWTFILSNSEWLRSLYDTEPLLETNFPRLTHYVIGSEDDVIEVLSPDPPTIAEVAPGTGLKAIGKSQVYYNPQDREQIEKVIGRIRGKTRRSISDK